MRQLSVWASPPRARGSRRYNCQRVPLRPMFLIICVCAVHGAVKGVVTFEEIRTNQDQLRSDPAFNPDFNQLVDGTRITTLEVSPAEALSIAGRTAFSSKSRRAWVATEPSVFGMRRLGAVYHELNQQRMNDHLRLDFEADTFRAQCPHTFPAFANI
jgi:hypothetical protein